MNYFKQKSDRLPIVIITFLFLIDVYMYLIAVSGWALYLFLAFSIFTKWLICAWNHHHQHVQTFARPLLNRLLEIMYGFQTGIVWYGWVLHHNLWHHIHYQDQEKDQSAWKSPKGKQYWVFMYTCIVSITAYYRSWVSGKKHRKIQKYFLAMCLIQLILLALLISIKPLHWILIFFVPMITGLLITVYTTYDHHSWLEDEDPYKSSYNITTPWYNFLTGNLGYHTAHHLKGSLHWSKLPAFHKTIEDKIGAKYYKNYSIIWRGREK
jgi:fatty acid desaturase